MAQLVHPCGLIDMYERRGYYCFVFKGDNQKIHYNYIIPPLFTSDTHNGFFWTDAYL